MTILRRLDCVLDPTREQVRDIAAAEQREEVRGVRVRRETGLTLFNTSP
jgi:type I restriction enzyme M protein